VAGFAVAAVFALRTDTATISELNEYADAAFKASDFPSAEAAAVRAIGKDPHDNHARIVAARSAAALKRPQQAIDYLKDVDDGHPEAVAGHILGGEVLSEALSRPYYAAQEFRHALALDPRSTAATLALTDVLKTGTCVWERIPLLLPVVAGPESSPLLLKELALNDRLQPAFTVIEAAMKEHASDPLLLMGMANLRRALQNPVEAEALYRQAIRQAPELMEAQVRLGWALFESGNDGAFLKWHAHVPSEARAHPLLWTVRAAYARKVGQKDVAIRSLWEALRIDANLQSANYQIGQLLAASEKPQQAALFLDRSKKLVDYVDSVNRLNIRAKQSGTGDFEMASQVVRAAHALGLVWEEYAWLKLESVLRPGDYDVQKELERLKPVLSTLSRKRTKDAANPAYSVDLSKFPLPHWNAGGPSGEVSPGPPSQGTGVSFQDQAAEAGVGFQYFNGADPEIKGLERAFHFTGGGVAVLDYDLDGWPDLYFAQGSKRPADASQTEHLDRLFRNEAGGAFRDVTPAAALVESGYSQGVAVGDVNNDGFPDLFVANIGPDTLFLNNGDGTFSNATAEAGIVDDRWTTSAVIADLNGDGLPDIYAVNYLSGDYLSRLCRTRESKVENCQPASFSAEQDRLWLNQGDGRFEDVSQESGIVVPNGKGLGIVAADVDGAGKLNLFIANDGVPNYYFINRTPKSGERPRFVEQAFAAGLAVSGDGLAQAGMGIAAGDLDGDGLLDFCVTNFTQESSTVYRQQPGGTFVDVTRLSGIYEPTHMTLGFGTQCLDGDLDGNLDLIATNGHIDRYEHLDYEMSPAYFENDGTGKFTQLSAETLGPFFKGAYLGRGLARLDWNRDGREDVAISHLDVKAALLTNTTSKVGHFVILRFVAVRSARDAIGTVVKVKVGGKTRMRQLTAGDGYEASNERAIIVGLGKSTNCEEIAVRWPSGTMQLLKNVPADGELLLVEGRPQPARIPATHH